MYRKLMFLISLAALLSLVNAAWAIDWKCGGVSESVCDPCNWEGGVVPGPGQEARADGDEGCDILIDCDFECGALRMPAYGGDGSQDMNMVSGNVVCNDWRAAYEGDITSITNITGGTLTATSSGDSFRLSDDGEDGTWAYYNFGGDAVLTAPGNVRSGDNGGNIFWDVSGDCVWTTGGYSRIGDDGGGGMTFRGNCSVEVEENLRLVVRGKAAYFNMMENAEIWVGEEAQLGDHENNPCDSNITGGTLNADVVKIGQNGKTYVQTGGLVIGRDRFRVQDGSTATLKPGGTIMADRLDMDGSGVLDIEGTGPGDSGILILDGYKLPEVWEDYVPNGKLTGNGSPTGIAADYGLTNPGKTTVWAETPVPCQAYAPKPYDTSVEVAAGSDIILSWTAGEGLGLGRHHVFFGQDRDCVANADCGPAGTGEPCWKAQLRASTTQWNSGLHPLWQTSYWRIDEAGVTCCQGKVWSFTTGCALIPGDTNLDCVLNFDDYADVASTYGGEQYWPE